MCLHQVEGCGGADVHLHGQAPLRLLMVTHNFQSTLTMPLSPELAYRLHKVGLSTTLGLGLSEAPMFTITEELVRAKPSLDAINPTRAL